MRITSKQFQEILVIEIEQGRPVIYTDLDGTLVPLAADPEDVRMDRGCYEGLMRLAKHVTVAALTGRDVRNAKRILTPGYAEGDRTLPIVIIGSHGLEKLGPDDVYKGYDFDRDFKPGTVSDFVNKLKGEAAALRETYPGIHVEDEKHGSVSINVATIAGAALRETARKEVEQLMNEFAQSPDNPVNPATGQKLFQIKREGKSEFELRPIGYGKDFGIKHFGEKFEDKNIEPMIVFFCDSLGPDGTDLPAAKYVKEYFPNGYVVWVSNGQKLPSTVDIDVVFDSPEELGAFFMKTAAGVEPGPDDPVSGPESPTLPQEVEVRCISPNFRSPFFSNRKRNDVRETGCYVKVHK